MCIRDRLIAVQLAGKLDPRMFGEDRLVSDGSAQNGQVNGQGDSASKMIVAQGLVGLGYACLLYTSRCV